MSFEKGGELTVPLNDELETEKVVSAINVGAQDLNIFIGVNGPYWTDVDGDLAISWVFNTGDGDEASRTITDGEVTIGGEVYDSNNSILPANALATVASGVVVVGGVQHGDLNHNTKVDVGESIELNPDAIGFALADADLALTILRPTDTTDKTRYTALEASAAIRRFCRHRQDGIRARSFIGRSRAQSRQRERQPRAVAGGELLEAEPGRWHLFDRRCG